jgi:hypothetical protein
MSIFLVLLATLAAFAHAERKPEPKPCLTSGCKKLTIAYDLGSMGMAIARATQHQQVYALQRKRLTWPWDSTGHFVTPDDWQQRNLPNMGMKNCYDPSQRPTRDQLNLLSGIVTQLKQNYYAMPDFYWTVFYTAPRPECLNSNSIATYGEVNFFTTVGKALRWNRDAIAAVMAHEVGHLTDKYCATLGQNITATAGSTALQQVCEKHADNIGIQYVVGAGFNPNGFLNTFQTFQRYVPTNIGMRYSANHPINADRIANVGLALEELCKENIPRACEYGRLPESESAAEAKPATVELSQQPGMNASPTTTYKLNWGTEPGFEAPDPDKVYSQGQKIKVEEPHGAYSGLLEMDAIYFVRISKVGIQETHPDGADGWIESAVRHATAPSWKGMNFSYSCELRKLQPGQIEVARGGFREGQLNIGSHDSVCLLTSSSPLP